VQFERTDYNVMTVLIFNCCDYVPWEF